jgi:hypothetical protein
VIAGIDVFDIPGERGRAVADRQHRKITDFLMLTSRCCSGMRMRARDAF